MMKAGSYEAWSKAASVDSTDISTCWCMLCEACKHCRPTIICQHGMLASGQGMHTQRMCLRDNVPVATGDLQVEAASKHDYA
jgi:hypothetical protein